MTNQEIKNVLTSKLSRYFAISPEEANAEQIYKTTVLSVRDILAQKNRDFTAECRQKELKQVYYLCMEFLVGRSLKNNLMNLGIENDYRLCLDEMGFDIDKIYEMENDPGLGNGGLGRLASCFMDSLATLEYPARGYSLCYEYGFFKQRIIDGEQLELPDIWLPSGECWLIPRNDKTVSIKLGGRITEKWTENRLEINHLDYYEIEAVPYDLLISGADGKGVSTLRLWRAHDKVNFNMEAFSQGQYVKAVEDNTLAEAISKVLYPADNHAEGKLLRLSQQYFLVSASLQNIISKHIDQYKTMENFAEKNSIHINDTHPALAVPELMRVLIDEHNYSWEKAWDITIKTISYTNHTVLPEALECWNENLFRVKLPRIHSIICEINRRFCETAWEKWPGDWKKVSHVSIVSHGQIRMANLSIVGSHKINGVSKLHSDILKNSVFRDFADLYPNKFTNITNGIAHRKWLCYSNPRLSKLLDELISPSYRHNPADLEKLLAFKDDSSVAAEIGNIKQKNKVEFSNFLSKQTGITLDPLSIYDVQVKRLHEYKRQLMNALHIASLYIKLKENPDLQVHPRTFIFGAKAAPGYYLAKDIIRFICYIAADIEKNPKILEKLRVVFLENYNVSLAERLIPASEVSEQISLAGKEASGTGNMKFMINGALTIGTLDGANVEIAEAVGSENIFIFGHTAQEIDELWKKGYASSYYYNRSESLKKTIDYLQTGFNGRSFADIAAYLLYTQGISDPFMCLADFDFYAEMHKNLLNVYEDSNLWNKMALVNIAKAGIFASDRSINEYAENIWNLKPNNGL